MRAGHWQWIVVNRIDLAGAAVASDAPSLFFADEVRASGASHSLAGRDVMDGFDPVHREALIPIRGREYT